MKKALMNASVASMIYKFNMNNIDILEKLGYQVDVACNFGKENPISQKEISDFRKKLKEKSIKVYETTCPRSILAVKNMWTAYKQLKTIADNENYELVHTQSPIGGVVCRLAFKKARKKGTKVIYQAHGFHFYKGAPLLNWLLFYPIEKFCSRFTDVLITINKEDYEIAKKKFHAKRVEYVPGVGLDLSRFNHSERSRYEKRIELGIKDLDTVFLSVGELNENKNHEAVIKALAQLNGDKSLDSVKYLICGQGEKKDTLEKLAEELGLKDIVRFLGFRTDVSEIYEAADVFVFPSFREGLSVALMEAMCCGLPVLCSSIRGNTDLIDKNGGILFAPDKSEEIVNALKCILNNEQEKKSTMGLYNKNKIKHFDLNTVKDAINTVYGSIEQAQNVGGGGNASA